MYPVGHTWEAMTESSYRTVMGLASSDYRKGAIQMDIRDTVVIITGASAGLGEATARLFAGEGARVALAARSVDALNRLAAALPHSLAVPTDMCDGAAIARMVARVHAHYGRIDLLINNAGQAMRGPVEHVDVARYRALMDVNLYGPLLAMQAVIPLMRAQGGGLIFNISTALTKLPMHLPGLGAYVSTKDALNALTLTARAELAADNIRVGVIYPGLMTTAFGTPAPIAAAGWPGWPGAHANAPGSPPPGAPEPETPEAVAALILDAVRREPAELEAHRAFPGAAPHGADAAPAEWG